MQQEVRVEEETPEDNARAAAAVTSDAEEDQEKELPSPPPAKRSCTLLENLLGPAFTNQGRNLYFLKCEVLHLAVG